jgi:hypothetical protein
MSRSHYKQSKVALMLQDAQDFPQEREQKKHASLALACHGSLFVSLLVSQSAWWQR